MVEGRPADPGGGPVRRERRDVLPRQWRPLVHLADGDLGRRYPRQGRPGPVPAPGRRGGVWLCPAAGGRPLGQPDRGLLVRHVHAPVALLLRAQRRHDLRGRLPAGGLFLPPVRAGRRGHAGLSWVPWPPAGPWGPRRSASSSCRRCSPWSIAGLLLQPAPRRVKWLRIAIVATVPLATGGYWFLRDAVADRQPALSPGRPRAGAHALGRLVRTRRDAHESLLPARAGDWGRWRTSCWPSSTPGSPRSGSLAVAGRVGRREPPDAAGRDRGSRCSRSWPCSTSPSTGSSSPTGPSSDSCSRRWAWPSSRWRRPSTAADGCASGPPSSWACTS